MNTLLGNLKRSLDRFYHLIEPKYLARYSARFQYRFNRRYDLAACARARIIQGKRQPGPAESQAAAFSATIPALELAGLSGGSRLRSRRQRSSACAST